MQVMLLNRNQARMIRASVLGSFAALFIVSASNFIVAQETPKVIVPAQGDTGLKDPKSYALGFQVGKDMASSGLSLEDFDIQELMAGFTDGLAEKGKLNEQQIQQAMVGLQERVKARMIDKSRKNLEKANEYLKANKDKRPTGWGTKRGGR
jgi:hypothetical protein